MYDIAITYGVVSLLLLGGFAYITFKITANKQRFFWLLSLLGDDNESLMKELQQDTIDQIRTHLMYLKQTDLLKNKDIIMCLDIVEREYGGVVIDKN